MGRFTFSVAFIVALVIALIICIAVERFEDWRFKESMEPYRELYAELEREADDFSGDHDQ